MRSPLGLNQWRLNCSPLQSPVQRRPRQMRDGRLQGIEAIVERQQRMAAKGDDHRLILDREDRRLRLGWPHRQIGHRGPLLPLGDRLLVDPVALGQRSQARLTMLYRSPLGDCCAITCRATDGLPLSLWRCRAEPVP